MTSSSRPDGSRGTQLMALASARASTAAADGEATGEPGVAAPPAAAKPPSARPLRVVIMEAGAGGNVTCAPDERVGARGPAQARRARNPGAHQPGAAAGR